MNPFRFFLFVLFPFVGFAKLEIKEIKREKQVDYQEEVLPILRANCLACHNRTRSKGDVVMETPDDIRKGNEGGSFVEAGNAEESFLFQLAAHTDDPVMPPAKNKVGARNLTPDELGLLKLWIDQGAKGTLRARLPVTWQAYQREMPPIYATAVNRGGRFAVAGRGNLIHLYDLAMGEIKEENLTDPSLAQFGFYGKRDAAHLDVINSLAFSADGKTLASGGYRTVKLWKRTPLIRKEGAKIPLSPDILLAVDSVHKWAISFGEGNGSTLWSLPDWKRVRELGKDMGLVQAVAFGKQSELVALGAENGKLVVFSARDGSLLAEGNSTNSSAVTALAFSNEPSPTLVVGRGNKAIEAWPVIPEKSKKLNWAPLREMKGHSAPVGHLCFHPTDGNLLFSGSADSTVRAWKFKEGNVVKSISVGTPVEQFSLSPDGGRFAVSGIAPGGSLWDYITGKKIADLKGNPDNQLSSELKDRELAFAKTEQTYYKVELKKRQDERKKVADRQKAVEKSLMDAEAKPIAEKKKAMEKARVESENATKELKQQEDELVDLEKNIPDAEAKEKLRAAELKEKTERLFSSEKKEKEALFVITGLEKAFKTKEAARNSIVDKMELITKKLAVLDKELTQTEEKIKQSAEMPEAHKQANQKKTDLLAQLKVARQEKTTQDKLASDARVMLSESDKALQQAKKKSDLAVKDADGLRKEKKRVEDLAIKAKASHTQAKKARDDLKKSITTAKADLKKKVDAFAKAEKEYQVLENPRIQFVRDLERAKEDLVKADDKIKVYELSVLRSDHDLNQSGVAVTQAKEELAVDAKRVLVSLSFSKDGGTLWTIDQAGLANLWAAQNQGKWLESHQFQPNRLLGWAGEEMGVFEQSGRYVTIDPGGDWVLDQVIGGDLAQTPITHRVSALSFGPDGKFLATGGGDPSRSGEVIVWELKTQKMTSHFPDLHSDVVTSLEFSRDGKLLVSGGADKFARVTERETGNRLHAFEGHTSLVMGASLQANGRILASVGADGEVKVWNLVNGDRAGKQGGYSKEITSIRFLGLTDQALVTTADKKARIIRVPLGNPTNVRDLPGVGDVLHSGSASVGGGIVVAGGESGVLRVWKVADGKLQASFDSPVKEEVAKLAP